MEEVGVSFPLRDGHTAQLSLYRFRAGQGVFTAGDIELLETLRAPVGAALRHHLLRFDPLAGRVGHRSRDKLTAREQQVADCLLSGRTAHATGRVLGISTETVKTYRKTIYSKLGIVSLLELHKLVQGQRLGAACG
jgi:DNA-binding CsgD family transcriptional regulator